MFNNAETGTNRLGVIYYLFAKLVRFIIVKYFSWSTEIVLFTKRLGKFTPEFINRPITIMSGMIKPQDSQ
jgi:hypothetical protein